MPLETLQEGTKFSASFCKITKSPFPLSIAINFPSALSDLIDG